MHNTHFYGEVVAKISAYLHTNPAHKPRIEYALSQNCRETTSVLTLCADAGRVFNTIEDLSSDAVVDWSMALEGYSRAVLNFLLTGRKPDCLDMLFMASHSISEAR